MTDKSKLVLIKTIHTLVWIFFNIVIFYMLYAVLTNNLNKWLWIGYGLFVLEGITLLAILVLAFFGNQHNLRLPAFLNGVGMAIALIISGFWSAPAHGDLADGFNAAVHDRLMTANLVRSLAWTLCGVSAMWIVARLWSSQVSDAQDSAVS